MISHISGTALHTEPGLIVIDVAGIGYGVHVARDTASKIKIGDTISLWTHMAVRETSMDLFGFADRDELAFFEMLLAVPGIGPKSALAVLSLASAETLRRAIAEENITYLTKVSGIGKKTAERIVVTLKDRLGSRGEMGGELREDADVVEVLVSLGYSQTEARDAVKKIDVSKIGTNERIKEALKILGGR
ncbi:MAG: Holliday junction branch migration protein RuvA [Candidatus Campbellbacteria bacterium]|nr:Holliday junction branch migration protein RuvA [Candidatus Campbellbacteria bacterium]